MLKPQKLSVSLGLTFLLLVATSFIVGCSSIERKEIEVKPIDNGLGVPGVIILRGYDEESDRFEGLFIGKEQNFIYIDGDDVNGGVLLPRNRALELLSKEAGLSVFIEKHPELIDELLQLIVQEEKRLRDLVNKN